MTELQIVFGAIQYLAGKSVERIALFEKLW